MGWTSVIEINHDRLADIDRDPAAWVEALRAKLSHGETGEITGGRVVAAFPRYDGPTHKAWEAFKQGLAGAPPRQEARAPTHPHNPPGVCSVCRGADPECLSCWGSGKGLAPRAEPRTEEATGA